MNASACPSGRQQDVAAGLVRLRLDGEADAVALLDHVGGEQVEALAVAVERGLDVLGAVVLGALAATPEDVGLSPQLGGQVEVAHHLAQRVATHAAVVAGEAAVLEHRVGEQVGGDHRDDQAGLGQRVLEPGDLLVALARLGAERHQVVVVERHAPRAELAELVHRLDRVEVGAGRVTERVTGLPADRPQSEAELVGPDRLGYLVGL